MSDYARHIKDLANKVKSLKEKLEMVTGREKFEVEEKLKHEQEHWKLMSRHLLCIKTLALDEDLTASALAFADFQMTLLMNALCPNLDLLGDDSQMPAKATQLFSAYPEHYLEDLFDLYALAIPTSMKVLMGRSTEWVSRFTILFTHYDYIKSPFLTAKLVRVLTAIQGPLWYNVTSLRMVQDKLLLCLIKFYSDFEDNGDFYEKFNVRGNIQWILNRMSDDIYYKGKFMDMARECGAEFIRFVNMIINDATWCIDESLSGLKSIHDVEKKMAK